MLDTGSDVMRMDTTEHSVNSALHLGMKSERIFSSECHLNGCPESDYALKSYAHLHNHHHHPHHPHHHPTQSHHRNGLAADASSYVAVSSPKFVDRIAPVGRPIISPGLHHPSPIGSRHNSTGFMSSGSELLQTNEHASTPVHWTDRTVAVSTAVLGPHATNFNTAGTTLTVQMPPGTDALSARNGKEWTGLGPKHDHSETADEIPRKEYDKPSQSTPNVDSSMGDAFDASKSCFTACIMSELSWNHGQDSAVSDSSDGRQNIKPSSDLGQLTVQTDHVLMSDSQSHGAQTNPSLMSDVIPVNNKNDRLAETSQRYRSPLTNRSDPGDQLSQTPTSGSDDELRAHLQSLQRDRSAPLQHGHRAVCHHQEHQQLRVTEVHAGPANGHEDAASLEVSSETQHAMESSDSSPPSSSGPGNRGSMEKTNPIDDLERDINFSGPDSSPLTEWHVRLSHTSVKGQHKCIVDSSNLPDDTEHCVKRSAEIHDVDLTVQHSPMPLTDSDPLEKNRSISMTGDDPPSSPDDSDDGMSMARFEHMTNSIQPDRAGLFFCHLCDFTGGSRQEFQDHLRSHYDYKCLKCDYTSRTEGRLKRHMKDFHSEVPPDNFSGKVVRPMRPKLQRCKQCDFMTETKDEFWRHLRIHIKEDKRLECNLCCFVTEYKHHLEYHMRNHMGSKPYKCPKCNYECVNKSMLNSHMKSHSNVYPYRCANCHYATKYCHSLKLHLAKHDHKPAVVLNADGSLPTYDNTAELMSLRRGGGGAGSGGTGLRQGSATRFHAVGYKTGENLSGEQQQQQQQPLPPTQQNKQSQQHQPPTPTQHAHSKQNMFGDPQSQQPYINPMSTLIPFGQTPLVRPFAGGTLPGLSSIPGFEHFSTNPLMTPNGLTTPPFPPMHSTTPLPSLSGLMFPTPLFDSPPMFPGWLTQPGKPVPAISESCANMPALSVLPSTPCTQTLSNQPVTSRLLNYYDPLRTSSMGPEFALSAASNPSMMAAFLAAMHQSTLQSNAAIATAHQVIHGSDIASITPTTTTITATELTTNTMNMTRSYSSSDESHRLLCQTARQVGKYHHPTRTGSVSLSAVVDRKQGTDENGLRSAHEAVNSTATDSTTTTAVEKAMTSTTANYQTGQEPMISMPLLKRPYSATSIASNVFNELSPSDAHDEAALDLSAKLTHRTDMRAADTDPIKHKPADESLLVPVECDHMIHGEIVPKQSRLADANESRPNSVPANDTSGPFDYECRFCEIRFRQRALYDIHMGFHSHTDPYLCNRCGHQSRNPVDFFIHLGQMAHHV